MPCVSCVSQGTSVCQVTLIGLTVIFLYASRACYNLVVLALTDIQTINSFDYDWYNVSDQVGGARLSRSRVHADVEPLLSVLPQADLRSSLGDAGYVVFGVILFVWELLPTSLVVFFFRVRRPAQERVSGATRGTLFLCGSQSKCDLLLPERICHSQPRLLQPAVLLRQSQTLRQRR